MRGIQLKQNAETITEVRRMATQAGRVLCDLRKSQHFEEGTEGEEGQEGKGEEGKRGKGEAGNLFPLFPFSPFFGARLAVRYAALSTYR